MGLVSATEMLNKAKEGHYAVGQFNINNLEWTKSILLTAEELKAPVILGVSEGAAKYMTGFKTVSAMVSAMVDSLGITVPVALHSFGSATSPLPTTPSSSPPIDPKECKMRSEANTSKLKSLLPN